MSNPDDLLYAPVGSSPGISSTYTLDKVNIHITVLSPALLTGTNVVTFHGPPLPGMHYAFPESVDEVLLESELRRLLKQFLYMSPPEAPCGTKALLHGFPTPAFTYLSIERARLELIGVNPIHYAPGLGFYSTNHIFCSRAGLFAPIVGPTGIDQNFLDLAA